MGEPELQKGPILVIFGGANEKTVTATVDWLGHKPLGEDAVL